MNKNELDTADCDVRCTRHATSGSLKDSESDSARGYRRAEFHEAEIHLDSFHACDDSGCKMPQWKPAYSHGNQLLRRLEVPHPIWPVGGRAALMWPKHAKAMIIFEGSPN